MLYDLVRSYIKRNILPFYPTPTPGPTKKREKKEEEKEIVKFLFRKVLRNVLEEFHSRSGSVIVDAVLGFHGNTAESNLMGVSDFKIKRIHEIHCKLKKGDKDTKIKVAS